ncbi:MAG: PQQ-binding-like beta-propeller repeat protein [Puniceicoccales bacterium]|jgi:hypothetical protein|nr:PQQ-binding-like beta-propeller repeat protein [Puniceicoccales bacterium]
MKTTPSFLLRNFVALALITIGLAGGSVQSFGGAYMSGQRFVATDYTSGTVNIVEANGKISWRHPAKESNDIWVLPGGTLLFVTGNGVKELDPKTGETKFRYDAGRNSVYATQRLSNGNTFIGVCSAQKLLEVAPSGKVVKTISLIPAGKKRKGGHGFMRNARVLKNGNYLVAHYGAREVVEYSPEGKEVWQFKSPTSVHSATRLANGNTLIMGADAGKPGLYEVTPEKKIVWQVTNDDLPGKPLRFVAGFHVLPNGNILVSNWLGHGQFKKAPHLLEITRAKEIVWTYNDHEQFRTISSVFVFDKNNKPLPGEGLH